MKKLLLFLFALSVIAASCDKQGTAHTESNSPIMVKLGTVNQSGDSTYYPVKIVR